MKKLKVSIAISILVIVTIFVALISMVSNSYEVARIRNSLIADIGRTEDFSWIPDNPPNGFLSEQSSAPDEFKQLLKEFGQDFERYSSLEKSLRVSAHLAEGPGRGGGIKSSTLDAYHTIMTEKAGYCSDYTQVFNGIAHTANIPVREWGMSFDGYSGRGHAFNEIYDYELAKWVFIDSFNSFYVLDKESNTPLSALEFRDRLENHKVEKDVLIKPIDQDRFGFRNPAHAIEYYQRGAEQFYLWFGNNALSYDNHPVIRIVGARSRAFEQLAGITCGIFPRIKLFKTESNQGEINTLFQTRNTFLALTMILAILVIVLFIQLLMYRVKSKSKYLPSSKESLS